MKKCDFNHKSNILCLCIFLSYPNSLNILFFMETIFT